MLVEIYDYRIPGIAAAQEKIKNNLRSIEIYYTEERKPHPVTWRVHAIIFRPKNKGENFRLDFGTRTLREETYLQRFLGANTDNEMIPFEKVFLSDGVTIKPEIIEQVQKNFDAFIKEI